MTELFLGVDAGNTKTIAVVADARGVVLGSALGGLGDIYGVEHPDEAVAEVLRLSHAALACARERGGSSLRAVAFRLAGVDWPEDERLWIDAVRGQLEPERSLSVKNDGFALLRCGDADGVGVAIALGTGAAVSARGRGGDEFALSWWLQHPLGAAGLVADALSTVYRAEIGLAPPTALAHALPAFYGAESVEAMLHAFTRRGGSGATHRERARAAPVVLAEAAAGDVVAVGIVDEHARRVACYARACAHRVGLAPDEPFAVTLGGSVVRDPLVRAAAVRELARTLPRCRVVTEGAVPIVGAVLDALAEGGVSVDAAVRGAVLRGDAAAEQAGFTR